MKKMLFFRLCLMCLLALSAYSCRTDYLPEKETFSNNSAKFQLNSKRISLNEAKHKSVLLPKIEKAELALRNSKTNVKGRIINYGSGVSIDTDEVICIENGPNYHTYTFHINRENAPDDAPLENLVLSPMSDGSYQEYLITYDLSLVEKARLQAGLPVDTQGKSQVTKLVNGTFNNGNQLARLVCSEVSETIWVNCSEHVHNKSNVEDWVNCKATRKPTVYTLVTTSCIDEKDDIITPVDPGSGGGGSGGGGIYDGPKNPKSPCEGTTIPTAPQDGFLDENGCTVGAPSLPNLPDRSALKIDASLDTKVKCLLQKMSGDTNITDNNITLPSSQTNDNLFQKMLRKFNGVNAPKIIFKGENLGPNHLGVTKSLDYGVSFEIVINNQINSNLFTEATFIHELVHALMLNDLNNVNMIQWNVNTGLPELAYNIQTTCENNDFNSNIPEEHFAAVICKHIETFQPGGYSNPQWSHELFGLSYFDTQTYAATIRNYLVTNHNWSSESAEWQTAMNAQFGFNWKNEVSDYVSMDALQKTNYFQNWVITKGIANFPLSLNNPEANFKYFSRYLILYGDFDLNFAKPSNNNCN